MKKKLIFLLIFQLSSKMIWGQSALPSGLIPGLIESLESLIEIDKKNFNKLMFSNDNNYPTFSPPEIANHQIFLDDRFLASILFNLNKKLVGFTQKNNCAIVDLLSLKQIKINGKEVTKVLINFNDTQGLKIGYVDVSTYIEKASNSNCINSKYAKEKFNTTNIKATIKSLNITAPDNVNQCQQLHQKMLSQSESIYFCSQIEQVSYTEKISTDSVSSNRQEVIQSEKTRALFNSDQIIFLSNFCSNLSSSDNFCDSYFKTSFWQKAIYQQSAYPILTPLCNFILKKNLSNLTYPDAVNCFQLLIKNPQLCHFSNPELLSLNPKPSCDQISQSLNVSRLKNSYADCPGAAYDGALSHLSRILIHFGIEKINYPNIQNDFKCLSDLVIPAFNSFNKWDWINKWPNQFCSLDFNNAKEKCEPFIMGGEKHPHSFEMVISGVMKKRYNIDSSQNCKMIPRQSYNPQSLKYKSGCLIIYQDDKCDQHSCDYEVIYNQKSYGKIGEIKNSSQTPYFPIDLKSEGFSISELLTRKHKIKRVLVRNLSEVKRQLDLKNNSLIEALGCVEDLYPEIFPKRNFKQCSPVLFIIDSYVSHNDGQEFTSLNLRSSLDSSLAPRLVGWNKVFNSVQNYQDKQPQKRWAMYAISK